MRLHVLGGGPWQRPTVEKARSLGHWVLVTDPRPDCPAFSVADAHEGVDVLDVEATLDAARRHRVDGVLADTSDIGVPTAARVAQALGLPGIDPIAADRCTRKDLMRQAAVDAGCDSPPFVVLRPDQWSDAVPTGVGWPCIVKPADNQSGRGVAQVGDRASLEAAIREARNRSRCGLVVVEASVPGIEHIVDGIVVEGTPQVLAVATKLADSRNPTVGTRISYLSGEQFDEVERVLAPTVQRLLRALGLTQGPFHGEFMVEGTRVVPIDFAARGGGVLIYQQAVPHVSGVDLVAASVGLALGQRPILRTVRRRGACIEFLQLPPGQFDLSSGREPALRMPGISAVHLAGGGHVDGGTPQDKDQRPGWVVALADDTDTAVTRAQSACALLMAHLQPLRPSTLGDAR